MKIFGKMFESNNIPIEKLILEKNCASKTSIKIRFHKIGAIFSSKFHTKIVRSLLRGLQFLKIFEGFLNYVNKRFI